MLAHMQATISEDRLKEIAAKAFPGPGRLLSVSVLHWSASILVRNEYPVGLDELEYLADALNIPRDQVDLFTKGPNLEIQIDLDPATPIIRPPLPTNGKRIQP